MPLSEGRGGRGALAAGAFVTIGALAGLFALTSEDAPAGGDAHAGDDASRAAPLARRYALRLDERSSVSLSGAELGGGIALRATLALAEDTSTRRTRLLVEQVEELSWTVEGQEVEEGEASLAGARAEIVRDGGGVVRDVEVPEETRPEVARLLRMLALSLQAIEPEASDQVIEVPLGRVRARSEASPLGSGPRATRRVEVRWHATDYERIAGASADARADGEGTHVYERDARGLVRARYRERLAVVAAESTHPAIATTLEVDVEPREGVVASLSWGATRWVAAAQVASAAGRRALETRVAGLTFAQLLQDLERYGPGGVMPQHSRWLWRATGLLALEPERAGELGQACTDGTLEGAARSLALDLLANVGHAEAQAALRAVLADGGVAGGEDYPSLLQRAVLVEDPEAATLAFYEQRMDTLDGAAHRSAAVALGGLVRRARDHDPEGGGPSVARLSRNLEQARDPLDRRALLMALGNAQAREAERQVLRSAGSDDSEERAAALRALGRIGGELGRRELLSRALSDESPAVRREAMSALGRSGARDAELVALAAGLREGRFGAHDLPPLAELARRVAADRGFDRAPEGSDALVGLLEALLASPAMPRELGHQLAALRFRLMG